MSSVPHNLNDPKNLPPNNFGDPNQNDPNILNNPNTVGPHHEPLNTNKPLPGAPPASGNPFGDENPGHPHIEHHRHDAMSLPHDPCHQLGHGHANAPVTGTQGQGPIGTPYPPNKHDQNPLHHEHHRHDPMSAQHDAQHRAGYGTQPYTNIPGTGAQGQAPTSYPPTTHEQNHPHFDRHQDVQHQVHAGHGTQAHANAPGTGTQGHISYPPTGSSGVATAAEQAAHGPPRHHMPAGAAQNAPGSAPHHPDQFQSHVAQGANAYNSERPLDVRPTQTGGVAIGGQSNLPLGKASVADKVVGKTEKVLGKIFANSELHERGEIRETGGKEAAYGTARAAHD